MPTIGNTAKLNWLRLQPILHSLPAMAYYSVNSILHFLQIEAYIIKCFKDLYANLTTLNCLPLWLIIDESLATKLKIWPM